MKSTARRYRQRTGLWVGAALLAAGLLVMGRFVWRVEIRGTEQLDPAVITAALAEYGVHPGVLAGKIDARTVERRMQIRFAEIAWITVNVEGSRVTAILEEAVPPPAVLAGDLLVSGIMDNKMGESRLAHARGRVYAQVRERLEIFVPYEQRDYLLAGVARRRYLTVFGVEIPLQGRGAPVGPHRLEQVVTQPEGLFSLLPVTLREECYLQLREVTKTVSPQEAMRQAEKELALREQGLAAEVIHREAVGSEGPAGFTLAAEYLLERQIAVEAKVQAEAGE